MFTNLANIQISYKSHDKATFSYGFQTGFHLVGPLWSPEVEADPFTSRLRVTRRADEGHVAGDVGGSSGARGRRDSESAPLGAAAYNDQLRKIWGGWMVTF